MKNGFTIVATMVVAAAVMVVDERGAWSADPATAAGKVKQIIAHRGARAERPENTVASARRAIEVGATAVEVDARTTKDGELVLLHDATLEHTTNGKGPVNEILFADLRKLDAGSRFSPEYKGEP